MRADRRRSCCQGRIKPAAPEVLTRSVDTFLEVYEDEEGPVIKLLHEDVNLEIPGKMRVKAHAIELEATRGQARITASDDVVVKGETVHLN